jgi:radical SAM superfamily enzyme YgiQ (UPF0313 family)
MAKRPTFEDVRRERLAKERATTPRPSRPGPPQLRFALGFPNRYGLGMSNLGFQWTLRILDSEAGITAERFFVEDGNVPPRTLETGTPLTRFPVVAFSVSWEMDFPLVLRAISAAGIPLRSAERGQGDPVILMGGNCARINPVPLFPYVDVVAAGDAEKLVPVIAEAMRESDGDREELLSRLARLPGFRVPALSPDDGAPEGAGSPLLIQQKRPRESFGEHQLPHTLLLTPDTELSDKLLVEIARGCTEMCRFCWAAYAFAPLVRHPASEILALADRVRPQTNRIGLIATAVADHPDILPILDGLRRLDYSIALSSLKIDAISEPILELLQAQGERALALAPEAGNERLRRAVNKKVPDAMLEEKLRMVFRAGFTQVKLYLQIGLPGESDADLGDLVDLVRRAHELALEEGRIRGRIATVVAAVNTFVPKPHTPFESERLLVPEEIERRLAFVAAGLAHLPNTRLRAMPPAEAIWESYLAKADRRAGPVLEEIARGAKPSKAIAKFADEFSRVVWGEPPSRGARPWAFLRKSPAAPRLDDEAFFAEPDDGAK